MTGLYVHVPFCAAKCRYCDFYSLPGCLNEAPRYVDALLGEAQRHAGMDFDTLYLGGGTPSLLGAANLRRLMEGLKQRFSFSLGMEATLEANPESATDELLHGAREAGFNRISVGVQSLSDYELRSVGRIHTSERAMHALCACRDAGFDAISADLIVGLPGQTQASLERSLDGVLEQGVSHISLYCLSLEEGTPLALDPPADLPDDDVQAELFERGRDMLVSAGFDHYEISNFARPGRRCLHNLNYWRGGEYMGLGAAAASHLRGRRYRNRADLAAYLADPCGQQDDCEQLVPEQKAGEEAMLRLRLLDEGVCPAALAGRFGAAAGDQLRRKLDDLTRRGLLTCDGDSYRIPAPRVLTANPIMAEVI